MSKIEVGSLVEELEIDEVARPLTSLIGDGMELLRDLVVGTHDRHRLRGRKAHLGEESGEISSELALGFVRVTDLVVAQFELHGAPGPASIVELHLKGLHDVCPRHSRRARCSLLHESPGEARPSRRERILEVASELGEWLDTRRVEVYSREGDHWALRIAEAGHEASRERLVAGLYSREMLIARPLLQALTQPKSPVLLIDELDRADEPFEAFLLEVLAESQLSVPELGTIRAEHPPVVIITSNRTREIHDALKRRCLYHWVEFPDVERELEIVRLKAPGAPERLSIQVVEFVQRMRTLDLFKAPGVAETIDWTNALVALNAMRLDPQTVHDTLGVLLKYQDDIARMQGGDTAKLLDELRAKAVLE